MFNNIVTIILNIFLGISLVGTISCIVLFIVMKLHKLNFIESILSKFCIVFIITWIIFIICNVCLMVTYKPPSAASISLLYNQ